MKRKLIIPLVLLLGLALYACSAQEASVPQTATVAGENSQAGPAEELPTTDEQIGVRVTSISQIEGTWIAAADLGNFVVTINQDGTFRVASSLEDLERGSTDSWRIAFAEDGQITASEFAMCLGDAGSYLAVINQDGSLKFTSIIDPCEPRLRKMDRSLPGRLNPYNLIYYRVEFND